MPQLGIKKGMSLKTLHGIYNTVMLNVSATASNGASDIEAENIVVSTPPLFISSEYTPCWRSIGIKKGKYSVIGQGGDSLTFSYDFQDAIANVEASLTIKKIDVEIKYTDNGVVKTYTKTGKASNAFNIPKTHYPLNVSLKAVLESEDCGEVAFSKALAVGGIPIADKQWAFAIIGEGGDIIQSRFTQKDYNDMFLAKLNNLRNYIDDLIAGDYVNTVNQLKAQADDIQAKLGETQYYTIGAGMNARVLTAEEFLQQIYSDISSLTDKITALQK